MGVVTCYCIAISSKDGLVKMWDIVTQHCFQTLVSHHREVWSLGIVGVVSEGAGLLMASGDAELKVYQLSSGDGEQQMKVSGRERGEGERREGKGEEEGGGRGEEGGGRGEEGGGRGEEGGKMKRE